MISPIWFGKVSGLNSSSPYTSFFSFLTAPDFRLSWVDLTCLRAFKMASVAPRLGLMVPVLGLHLNQQCDVVKQHDCIREFVSLLHSSRISVGKVAKKRAFQKPLT